MAESALSTYVKKIETIEPSFNDAVQKYGYNMQFASEARFALAILRGNEDLQACTPASVANAVLNAAAIGLSLNPDLKHAYLVPYKSRCVLTPGYQGLVHLALADGYLSWVTADVVYEGDRFEFTKGTNPRCDFTPQMPRPKKVRQLIGAFAAWQTKDGSRLADFMDASELEKVRAASKMKSGAVWTAWPDEMRKKAIIKRASKLWQKTDRLARQIALAHSLDDGGRAKQVSEPLNEDQVVELSEAIGGDNKLLKVLCEAYGIMSPGELMQHQFADALKRVRAYHKAKKARRK